MTNTERLIYSLECAKKSGLHHLTFMVGRWTGNGPSVVNALRRRGYEVTKVPASGHACYRLAEKQQAADTTARDWLNSIGSEPQ